MLHRSHLAPYGYAAGTKEIGTQLGQTAITGVTAAALSAVEGYSGKEYSLGPVPLTLVVGGALHAAAFLASDEGGEVMGVDADYIHSAGAGAIAVWAANRGFELGKKMKEKKAAAPATPPATTAPPATKGLPQGYAGYRPNDVYASQFTR